jgi:hypothetical protein
MWPVIADPSVEVALHSLALMFRSQERSGYGTL